MRTLLITLSSCVAVLGSAQTLIHPGSSDEVAWSQIEAGASSPVAKPGVQVITSQHQFDEFNKAMHETDLKRPTIDWSKNQLVVVTSQGYANEGFGLTVKRLHITDSSNADIEVIVSKNVLPQPHLVASYNYPYAVLETPKSNLNWHIRVLGT